MSMLDPIPQYQPVVDQSGRIDPAWYRWLFALVTRLQSAPVNVASVHRAGLGASVSATTIYTPTQPGHYRVTLSVQVTTASGATSSIGGTLTWKVGGVTQTETLAALTGNTTGTHGQISVTVYPDAAQPVQYTTAWASTGAPAMAYSADVTVESLG